MASIFEAQMARKRALAQQLQAQAQQPLQGKMVSGIYSAPTILDVAGQLAKGYMANKQMEQLDEQEAAYEQKQRQEMARLLGLPTGQQQEQKPWVNPDTGKVFPGTGQMPTTQGGMPVATPGINPNAGQQGQPDYRQLLMSDNPVMQKMGMAMYAQQLEAKKPMTAYQKASLDFKKEESEFNRQMKQEEMAFKREQYSFQKELNTMKRKEQQGKLEKAEKEKMRGNVKKYEAVKTRVDAMLNNVDYLLDEKNRDAVARNVGSMEGKEYYPSSLYDIFSDKDAVSTAGAKIESLKGQFEIQNLMKMREEMGGSIGSMTEEEWKKFQGMTANIRTDQSKEEYFKQLALVKRQLHKVLETHQRELMEDFGDVINVGGSLYKNKEIKILGTE